MRMGPALARSLLAAGCIAAASAAQGGARATDEAFQQARALVDGGRPEEGERAFRALLEAHPGEIRFEIGLANALLLQGRRLEAAQAFERVLERESGHYGALLKAGEIRWKLGYIDEAVRLLREAVSLRPDEPRGLRALGGALLDASGVMLAAHVFRRDLLEEAARTLEGAAGRVPQDARTRFYLALAYRRLEREGDAFAAYEAAARLDPSDAAPPLALGEMHLARGRFEEARSGFERAAALATFDPRPHQGIGSVRLQEGDSPGAIESFRRALEIDPALGEARYGLALACFRAGRAEEGRREMERFRRLGSEGSIEELQSRLRKSPDDRATRLALASRYLGRGDVDVAVAHLRLLAASQPDDATALTMLGFAVLRRGDAEEARGHFRDVVRHNPSVGLAWLGLGLASEGPEKREAVLQAAARLPEDPRPRLEIGRIELQSGNTRAAEEALWEAARLDPEGREALLLLAELYVREGRKEDESRAREQLALREGRKP